MSIESAKEMLATAPVQGTQEQQSPAAAAPTAPAPEAPAKEKDQFAEKLELLSKREQKMWRERRRLEAESKRLAEERSEYDKWKQSRAKAKENPLDYLSEAGLSYDKLTEFMLNGGKPTREDELAALRDEFKRHREEIAEKEKKQQEQQTQAQVQAQAQAIESFKQEIEEFVETNKATYEVSSQRDATEDIFMTINDALTLSLNEWQRAGRRGPPPAPMTIKEAADLVEEFYEKEVLRLAETSKLKAKLGLLPKEDPAQQKQPSKTLTNNMASTAASVVPAKNDQDRMRRAMAKLSGE